MGSPSWAKLAKNGAVAIVILNSVEGRAEMARRGYLCTSIDMGTVVFGGLSRIMHSLHLLYTSSTELAAAVARIMRRLAPLADALLQTQGAEIEVSTAAAECCRIHRPDAAEMTNLICLLPLLIPSKLPRLSLRRLQTVFDGAEWPPKGAGRRAGGRNSPRHDSMVKLLAEAAAAFEAGDEQLADRLQHDYRKLDARGQKAVRPLLDALQSEMASKWQGRVRAVRAPYEADAQQAVSGHVVDDTGAVVAGWASGKRFVASVDSDSLSNCLSSNCDVGLLSQDCSKMWIIEYSALMVGAQDGSAFRTIVPRNTLPASP